MPVKFGNVCPGRSCVSKAPCFGLQQLQTSSISLGVTTVCVAGIFVLAVRQMTFWRNSLRELMQMPTLESAYPYRTALIAVMGGAMLIGFTRLNVWTCLLISSRLNRLVPRRVSIVLSTLIMLLALFFCRQRYRRPWAIGCRRWLFSQRRRVNR